jgi:very-short-patch-repair endonuclease
VAAVTDGSGERAEAGSVNRPELGCLRRAQRQHGLITHSQAVRVGMTRRQIELRMASGAWERVLPQVYRVAGSPPSDEADLMAATLWAGEGAAASRRSAAALWGLIEIRGQLAEITSHRKISCPGVLVHRSYSLPPEDITRLRSIPVTTAARTLLDLGAVLSIDALERALERALHKKLTRMELLEVCFHRWTRQGRLGAGKWRRLLELRDPSLEATATDFETRMSQLTRRHGLPTPLRQYSVFEGDQFVARLDFAYPIEKVAIECDSEEWHLGRKPWQRDMRRYNALTALGWSVLRFSWWDVTDHPHQVASRIGDVLARRRRRLGV